MIELLLHAERALSVGMLDRAETLYRQVAAADPRNSIAFVGLSRVALDRGDELEALELARQGLALDPENNAAQRMVQRLEEIIDYRLEVEGPIMPARPDDDAALGPAPATAEPDEPDEPDEAEPEPTPEAPGDWEVAPTPNVEPEAEPPTEAEGAVDAGTAEWAAEPEPAEEGLEPVEAGGPPAPWPSPSPAPWATTDPWPMADVASGTPIDAWPEPTADADRAEPPGAFPDVVTPAPAPMPEADDEPRRSWFDRLFRRER